MALLRLNPSRSSPPTRYHDPLDWIAETVRSAAWRFHIELHLVCVAEHQKPDRLSIFQFDSSRGFAKAGRRERSSRLRWMRRARKSLNTCRRWTIRRAWLSLQNGPFDGYRYRLRFLEQQFPGGMLESVCFLSDSGSLLAVELEVCRSRIATARAHCSSAGVWRGYACCWW